ncbi:hypothetical protein HaLaN_05175 [Haematococcus lacustris]|uniref:Uncharacterized protein n=1 Tax=Haematococcus lacustris TaxID=44745 RepID=A0A699Z3F8_HAELA|nr:hypothetical protein HaLaN_05175 [Haematococcus lacustris]
MVLVTVMMMVPGAGSSDSC